jgi:hypothetical protein
MPANQGLWAKEKSSKEQWVTQDQQSKGSQKGKRKCKPVTVMDSLI